MILKKFVWQKLRKHIYRHMEESDKSMYALAYFLNDGLPSEVYLKFLEENKRHTLSGNISWLEKHGKMVSIEIDDNVYPDTPVFTTSISNLIRIIREYDKLEDLEVNRIEISFDEHDQVTITGE